MDIDDKVLEEYLPLTEESMLKALDFIKLYLQDEIPDVFYRMVTPNFNGEDTKEESLIWKDFFLRHGIINEKEEVIYKPQ